MMRSNNQLLANTHTHTPRQHTHSCWVQLGHHHLRLFLQSDEIQLHAPPLFTFCANHAVHSCAPRSIKITPNISHCSACTSLDAYFHQAFSCFGANILTASPTDRNILSSPISSVNFAARSFWITIGPGLARIS